jgi:4-amino-4-deoxy-L-arabinose transferase-like glycosyltransferase
MVAHGHLWLPPFPPQVVDFFDSFYLIMDRVYAGMYPPGTAILLLPTAVFGIPHWLMPAVASAAAAIFFYLILNEIFGPAKAIVGVLLLLSSKAFASMSFMALSEAPFLLASLVAFWSWLRWRSNKKSAWLILLGVATGFGAVTRPADMLCTAAAIAIAMLIEHRRELKLLNKSAGIICLAASPFLAIQIIQNAGITGKWFEPPIHYYTDENYPSPILSFRQVTANDVPPTNCLPKQVAMKQWILPETEQHWRLSLWQIWYPKRFTELFDQSLPRPLLLIILPASLLALWEIRRLTVVGAAVLFCIIYTADTVFLPHYFLAITPAVICLILCALETIERTFHHCIATAVSIAVIVIAISAFPELKGSLSATPSPSDEERTINQTLAALPARPALVLFHFDPKVNSFHTEPVYNDAVAWPDDAQVVRARDLGPDENILLYRYYRDHGQNRDVYRYDRAAPAGQNPITHLGTVDQLARK